MSVEIKAPRKLIEVALPLDAINLASAKEKSIRHGHPSTLHLWWARRPLAAARAVLFAQMVNDPGYQQSAGFRFGMNKADAAQKRKELFKIIEDLVLWENTSNEAVLNRARVEIKRSWEELCELNKDHPNAKELFDKNRMPAIYDPFAGGGTIPLEAQRLGFTSFASDLNPVAVTINKAMIEIPPRFANKSPVGPQLPSSNKGLLEDWPRVTGLAEDIKRYGQIVFDQVLATVGHLYPHIEVTPSMTIDRPDLQTALGQKLRVIAWLWCRTVRSPSPAYSHIHVPLASTFVLSSKKGKEAYVEPLISQEGYSFVVRKGEIPDTAVSGTKLARGANFRCLLSNSPIEPDYIKAEGQAGRLGSKLLGIVVEGNKQRIYLSPTQEQEILANSETPIWQPDSQLPNDPRNFWTPSYGLRRFSDLYSSRQLVMLNTFSNAIPPIVERIQKDAIVAGFDSSDDRSLQNGGLGARAYGEAVGLYLGICVSKLTAYHCTLGIWRSSEGKSGRAFGRQAVPMVWDFPECNPFADAGGEWLGAVGDCAKVLNSFAPEAHGHVFQAAAQSNEHPTQDNSVVCTDPPYYDNVAYADLSDFFYVWLKRSLQPILPSLFSSELVPKAEELVATPYRHGNKNEAEKFFMKGMTESMRKLAARSRSDFPTVIYYAFKQAESSENGISSTGWETFLEAVIQAGFSITGTWPMRTEQSAALKTSVNSLASSIVLVCRKRADNASSISRRDFMRELNQILPDALDEMTKGSADGISPVAPVDLSQAIIGPGMAVFSKYGAILEADGSPMTVRSALQLINRFLAEEDFDHDTQFCLSWFEGHGWDQGKFGEADVLARAKGTSVEGLKEGGILNSAAGSVRLLRPSELTEDWRPESDTRISIWEILHHMTRCLNNDGESGAGEILSRTSQYGEQIRTLAYRLYTLCERKGWAQDSSQYDQLVRAWDGIEASAQSTGYTGTQISLFGEEQSNQSESSKPKKKTRKKR
jgi:putative DNA methylase